MKFRAAALMFCLLLALPGAARAGAEEGVYELRIKDHRFSPRTLDVPAGKKVKLVIYNDDPTPEEFESYELNREKVVAGGGKIVVFIGPLEAGTYPFFGEFHQDTATGEIVAK